MLLHVVENSPTFCLPMTCADEIISYDKSSRHFQSISGSNVAVLDSMPIVKHYTHGPMVLHTCLVYVVDFIRSYLKLKLNLIFRN